MEKSKQKRKKELYNIHTLTQKIIYIFRKHKDNIFLKSMC